MPHKCARCSNIYEDKADELLNGCGCGSRVFLYLRADYAGSKQETIKVLEKEEVSESDLKWLDTQYKDKLKSDTKTISISIDSPQPPNSTYTVSGEFISDNNDIFTFKIRNRTSTSLDLIVYRVDGGGWSTAPTCLLTLIGYA